LLHFLIELKTILTRKQRIDAFATLGDFLAGDSPELDRAVRSAAVQNPWYTEENTRKQLKAIAGNLSADKLQTWLAPYPDRDSDRSVGLVLAGNVPLVGFHDILVVLLSGFRAQAKVSSDDAGLTAFVLNALENIEPKFAGKIHLVDRLRDFDMVIATGSDNSSRYFEHYFGHKPHLIRRNRNSVAVLDGSEDKTAMEALGEDIFSYFGLGCRSVSKLYLPKNYDIAVLFEALEKHRPVRDHHKYANNYDYNRSICLINGDRHFDNGFLLLKEDAGIASPLATVFYEEYGDVSEVARKLDAGADKIQCLVSQSGIRTAIPTFPFGQSQCPSLSDYADGANTLEFLFS